MEADPLFFAGAVVAGKYRLTERLGSGGMGEVWAAEHLGLGSTVAVKLLHHDMARRSEVARRFEHEARAAAALAGDHVVRVFDHGFERDTPFIVMERLEGETLAARIRRQGALDPKSAARVVLHVARALGKAHEAGIIHRDVKPENVFLTETEHGEIAKLLDFGIAKVSAEIARRAGPTRTRSGALMGTPHYMSPERLREREIDHRADLWSLALVAFECMTGTSAFGGEVAAEVIAEVLSGPMPAPSERGPVPAGFDAWFARAAARNPAERFSSAREMADALASLVEGDVETTTAALPAPAEPPSRPWRTAAIAAVLAIAVVALVATQVREEGPPIAPASAATGPAPEQQPTAIVAQPPPATESAPPPITTSSAKAPAADATSAPQPTAARRAIPHPPAASATAAPAASDARPQPAPASSPTHPLGF